MKLIDPTRHPDWLAPHSLAWYQQLGENEGAYLYPWNSVYEEPNGESIFDSEVADMIQGKKALDVGCGHGDFTLQCADLATEIMGIDVTDKFLLTGNQFRKTNVSFMLGNTKERLPFEEDAFDCAYIRKGPTSAYTDLQRVVKNGGEVLGLHPGESTGKELFDIFPNLFTSPEGIPILDRLKQRLETSGFSNAKIKHIETKEYLQSPLDVLKYRCFGQTPEIMKELQRENLDALSRVFEKHASAKGLAVPFSRYIVRAVV
ncbi:methyltransferase domain-containing protein [Planococcus sp. N028]|uniref:Methyltransferase domain-containing protein n=1 Tax=Planococcus shixiaomingii TaxID=3058393 RepID=A0ABT8MZ66_9BACL|nr:methyltransferase domain-containing protein [Planococcus sp. N028]MDN7240943.1 methyltransferase domain-containing protein [Planococcus sp. N028]